MGNTWLWGYLQSHPKPRGNAWFLKRTMVEMNGKGINPWNGWVKTVLGSHFGVGEFTTHFGTYVSGDWDVHWGYVILAHGFGFCFGVVLWSPFHLCNFRLDSLVLLQDDSLSNFFWFHVSSSSDTIPKGAFHSLGKSSCVPLSCVQDTGIVLAFPKHCMGKKRRRGKTGCDPSKQKYPNSDVSKPISLQKSSSPVQRIMPRQEYHVKDVKTSS